ncbi:hypothetical protein Btru_026474 [Bulinus truncatus]|nr:hypothetical protein Btru_026474 [Bulinus truncatus]
MEEGENQPCASADISEKVAPEKYPSADISEKVAPEEYPSADISEKKVAPEEYLRDVPKFGNTFKFGNAGDYWHQAFPIGSGNDYRRHVKQIREMEIRDDDVLICSYPKTGILDTCSVRAIKLNKYIYDVH